MGLSCGCPDWYEAEWYYQEPSDFTALNTLRGRRCRSCGSCVQPGSEVLEFTRFREAKLGYEENKFGDTVDLASHYLCYRCGEIFLNLSAYGYCVYYDDDMRELLREHWHVTGFTPPAQEEE